MKRDVFSAENPADDGWSRTLMLPRAARHAALAAGTRVGEVEIAGVIGEGSAGTVYLAVDPSLERRVAVKEYLPSALASRAADGQVVVRSEALLHAFRAGLDAFIAEARLLARFDHPSLVKVFRVWEANGTAYLAMPYYEGPTLTRMLADLGQAPDEATLRWLLAPLLDALDMIHAAGQLHRDISPDNILLTTSGPVLLDFGVARRAIGGATHTPTVVLKRGYAPIEQYGESDGLKPGPWSDLYALGSVLHFAMTGEPPTSSVERLWDDWVEPLATSARGRYSEGLLTAVDAMLAVRPGDRPQDVAALKKMLAMDAVPEALPMIGIELQPVAFPVTAIDRPPEVQAANAAAFVPSTSRRSLVIALISAAAAIGIGLSVRSLTEPVERAEKPHAPVMPVAARVVVPSEPVAEPALVPSAPAATLPTAVKRSAPIKVVSVEPTRKPGPEPVTVADQTPATPSSAHWPARCFDILQKASLEKVGDEETAFLRDSCR